MLVPRKLKVIYIESGTRDCKISLPEVNLQEIILDFVTRQPGNFGEFVSSPRQDSYSEMLNAEQLHNSQAKKNQ